MAYSPYPYGNQSTYVPDVDPLTGMPKKKKAANPFQPGTMSLTPQQGLAQSNQIAGSFPVGLASAQFGGMVGSADPSSGGSAGPDYKALIAAALGPLSAQLGAEGVADASSRDSAVIRSLGQFGEQFDPATARQAFGDDFYNQSGFESVLPQANKLAGQTTGAGMSYTARASKAHKDAVRQIKNTLAGRGLLRSGELGHQLQEQQTQFDTGQYDARQQLADYLGGVQRGYTEGVRARQAQLAAAQREEAGRQAALNPMTGVPVAPPPPPAPVAPQAYYTPLLPPVVDLRGRQGYATPGGRGF